MKIYNQSLILPILLIFIAFFFVEKYNKKINVLHSVKGFFKKPLKKVNTRKLARKVNREIRRNINRDYKDNYQESPRNHSNINNNYISGHSKDYGGVTPDDYPLNNSILRQTKHYITKTDGDISVKLEERVKEEVDQLSELTGHEMKEHFTYYVGPQYDHLYH